ncbi:hypothetical protein CPAV1605_1485 [seawater metagenome]|uniref:Protein kinase domain-containing protein n=1 Tax=seawater metagenome TaxID=1561972 RepID=A0A5E8CMK3_9ZZZZ
MGKLDYNDIPSTSKLRNILTRNNKINHKIELELYLDIYNGLNCLNEFKIHKLIEILGNKPDLLLTNLEKIIPVLEIDKSNNTTSYYNKKNNKIYHCLKFIKKGSFHQIYEIKEESSEELLVLRKQVKGNKKILIECFMDSLIHMILSIYQGKILIDNNSYRGKYIIPKIYGLYLNSKKNKIISILDEFPGSVKELIYDETLSSYQKFKIIINCIYQIATYLQDFQKIFKFMHNDLKINNIFYKKESFANLDDNYNFFLADFGFSRIEFWDLINNKKIIYCAADKKSKIYQKSNLFIPSKDIYFLFHSFLFFCPDQVLFEELKEFGIKTFGKINLDIIDIKKGWSLLYSDYKHHLTYEPVNFLKAIHKSEYNSYITRKTTF